MGAPIVYRWDDTNAPVARGERESLIEILTACLVDGYGEKPAAGWTKEFENVEGTKAAFRNNPLTGTGFFLQIDCATPAANTVYYNGFETMSDVDNGLGPFTKGTTSREFDMSVNVSTTPRPWILFADDRFFYFFVYKGHTAQPTATDINMSMLCFGDGVARDQNDSFFCFVGGSVYGVPNLYQPQSANTAESYANLSAPRPADGSQATCTINFCYGSGPHGFTQQMGYSGAPYTAGGQVLYTRPFVNDGASLTFRGFAPGLYYPCHGDKIGQWEPMVMEDGRNLMIMSGYVGGGNSGQWFISLDDWRA